MSIEPQSSVNDVTLGSFFHAIELDVTDVGRYADAFDRLRRGELQGVIVHNVYETAMLENIVMRLESHDPPFIKTWFPEVFRSWFYGCNLNLTHPDLTDYFREVPQFHRQLDELFPSPMGLMTHLTRILEKLDHDRPFVAAPGVRSGEQYMFTTIRAHMEGGFIPPHCDNEQALRPSYHHLLTLIEPHIMSFVLAFSIPESGGGLEVFNHRAEPLANILMNDDNRPARPDINQLDSVCIRLPPGTMIILDSGRYLHRLSPVEGRKEEVECV